MSGSLRLSLMQRAPSAVRDHAAAFRSDQRQRTGSVETSAGLSGSSQSTSADEPTEDHSRDLQPAAPTLGAAPASEDQVARSDMYCGSDEEDGMDALAVLADVVESAPQSPPSKPRPHGQLTALPAAEAAKQQTGAKAGAVAGSGLGAISALAAVGSAAHAASEAVGPDVEFTVRELEVLTKEVERCGFSKIWVGPNAWQSGIYITSQDRCAVMQGSNWTGCPSQLWLDTASEHCLVDMKLHAHKAPQGCAWRLSSA